MAILREPKLHYGKLKLFIKGEWIESESETRQVVNPATTQSIADVPFSSELEVDRAVQAAKEAFKKWRTVPPTERVKFLLRLRTLIETNAEELARIMVQNHGRTISESRSEVARSLENIESACAVAYTLAKGENMQNVSPGIDQILIREPLGVFGIVTPFNIPMHGWSSYVPYALALGCTLVLKPSEITPIVTNRLFELMQEAGLQPGVANLIHGGAETVEALANNSAIEGIGFIGSTKTGRILYKLCGETGKRASINAGAKNHIVLMPDVEIEKIAPTLSSSFFGFSGQRCLAGSNLLIVGRSDRSYLDKFVSASKMKLGYGLDESTQMGPVSTQSSKERILGYIEQGVAEGANLIVDGRKTNVTENFNGYFVGPSIFTDALPDMRIAREEIFGPVASVIMCNSLDDAIEIINTKTNYGNAASIFTANGKSAREFAEAVNVGNVGVNIGIPQPMAYFPIGGRRESFFGMAHSRVDTVRFFTEHKMLVSRW